MNRFLRLFVYRDGRIHENGRKLNPSDIYFRGANDGAAMFMVGVYDPQSGLNGFINPNSPLFGLQNTDKPIYLNETTPLGNGVLTNGTIEITSTLIKIFIIIKYQIL